jgi:hypothetical protein
VNISQLKLRSKKFDDDYYDDDDDADDDDDDDDDDNAYIKGSNMLTVHML